MREEREKKESDALRVENYYSQSVLAVNGRKRTIDHRMETKSDESSYHGCLCFSTACSRGPEITRIKS
jgi:hypothetical protein